jgi:hypothetical protein
MSADYNKAARSLEKFLADDSHMTADDLRKELAEEGVSVDAFLARFGTVIRKGYQCQLKKAAELEQAEAKNRAKNIFGDLAVKSWDELQQIFESVRAGVFGQGLRAAALARCRNQVGDKVSESELRSWLEDISSAAGEE